MIILIDNYDSFSYNLFQLVGSIRTDIRVIRNDEMSVAQLAALKPDRIILSPGPGRPGQAGICIETVKKLGESIPVLGVCLGHQAIYEACGGVVSYAKRLMHGKQSTIILDRECPIFRQLPEEVAVARYHSLAAMEDTLPEELVITARDEEGEIMAVRHKSFPVYGLQFHPESILTPQGRAMIENFIAS